MVDINNNKTRAHELIERNRKIEARTESLMAKKAALAGIPEISNRMARGVSDERRDLMEMQLEAGEFREQGSGFSSRGNRDEIRQVQTPMGVVAHNGKGLYKMGSGVGNVASSASGGWRGSNDSVRQVPEVYSPLWLNSNLNLPRDRPTINAWSRSFFALNPIVHNAITLHSTYPIAKLNIKSKSPKVEKFFSQMSEEIDLMNTAVLAAQEYWILGEAFIYGELDESKGSWSRLMILNPDYVNVQRSVIAAEPIISLRPDENLRRVVFGNQPSDLQQRKQLDPQIIEHVRKNENIPLNNFYVHHMARRISPYEIRGTGLIVSCFRALMLWDKLRESKYAQADNMVNPLTLVKIGNQEFRPSPVDLENWRHVFECHDEETEVLTDQGFKKFDEVIEISNVLEATGGSVSRIISSSKQGVKIACFNPDNNQLEYHFPIKSHVYDYDGDMCHFHNEKMDIKVTPNHDMWVQRKHHRKTETGRQGYWGAWEKIKAEDVKLSDRRFRSKLEWKGVDDIKFVKIAGKEVPVELYLEFLGYLLSEGCLYTDGKFQHTIGISQTVRHKDGSDNPKHLKMAVCAKEFSKAIGKSYSNISKPKQDCGEEIIWNAIFCGWDLFKHFVGEISDNGKYKAHHKCIPRWILNLSPRLLNILLESLMLGDGTRTVRKINNKIVNNDYFTSSKRLADDVYEAAYKAGFVPIMFHVDDKRENKSRIYTVSWSNSGLGEFPLVYKHSVDPRTKNKKEVVSREHYSGKVWCFTVPTGLFVTRRNGKITIQGNSAQYDRDFKIFTHDAVTVERVGYGQGIYDTSADVTQLIKEIYIGLMVPSVIMDGSDTTYATGSVALDVLRQRYMQFRQMMTGWLKRKIFAPIAQIQDFYEYIDGEKTLIVPEIDWNHMSLFDMDSYINNMLQLTQGEGIAKRASLQTMYRSLGLEYEEEHRKIRYEDIQDAIRIREIAAMQRYSIHELQALGPGDEIDEVADEPVPGESPYEPPQGGVPGAGGMSGGGGLGPMPGAPPPAPIGGGGGGPKPQAGSPGI
jgi:hypothetical protein